MICRRRKLPSFPALEPLLAHEYNARFSGIRLLSIERVDLTEKPMIEPVEQLESLRTLSTERDASKDTASRKGAYYARALRKVTTAFVFFVSLVSFRSYPLINNRSRRRDILPPFLSFVLGFNNSTFC